MTFTYEETPKSFNGLDSLSKPDWQKFMKKFRKQNTEKLKYYVTGEYGDNFERPHFHAIMFNIDKRFINFPDYIADLWNHGIVEISPVTMARIKYVTKYMSKGVWKPQHNKTTGLEDDREPQFSLMSKNIGKSFLTPQMERHILNMGYPYLTRYGERIPIPRYYKKIINNFITHGYKTATTDEHIETKWELDSKHFAKWSKYQNNIKQTGENFLRTTMDRTPHQELEHIKHQFEHHARKHTETTEFKQFKYQTEQNPKAIF